MNIKFKIFSAISFISLAVVLTFVGVWAVADLDFKVGGDISYEVPVPVPAEDLPYLNFTYFDTSRTAYLDDCTDTTLTYVKIPSLILYNNKVYTVVGTTGQSTFSGVFFGCQELAIVVLPNTIIYIGDNSFFRCTKLSNINIPNKVTRIGTNSFSQCSSLTDIVIPDSVTMLDISAFNNCTGLVEVSIGNGILSIAKDSFKGCTSLSTVKIKATTPPTLNSTAFDGCTALSTIYVPRESIEAYKSAEVWSEYADLIVPYDF